MNSSDSSLPDSSLPDSSSTDSSVDRSTNPASDHGADQRPIDAHGEIRDVLPADLNAVDNVAPYEFPDNSRRRIPAVLYALISLACIVAWMTTADATQGTVNGGFAVAAVILAVMAVFSYTSGWKMSVTETDALIEATRAVGFAVGHASAQQVWRGVRSRPTWRIFCYSSEEPPLRRGLVLVDAVNGSIVEILVEDNPELTLNASSGGPLSGDPSSATVPDGGANRE